MKALGMDNLDFPLTVAADHVPGEGQAGVSPSHSGRMYREQIGSRNKTLKPAHTS